MHYKFPQHEIIKFVMLIYLQKKICNARLAFIRDEYDTFAQDKQCSSTTRETAPLSSGSLHDVVIGGVTNSGPAIFRGAPGGLRLGLPPLLSGIIVILLVLLPVTVSQSFYYS